MAAGIKDEVIRLVNTLPDTIDWDDLMHAIYERIVIERSFEDVAQGRVVSNDEARRRLLGDR